MVYDTISDNIVQIGISIANGTALDYDIVLKKHVSNIKEISLQLDVAPNWAIIVDDTTYTPTTNVLTTALIIDILTHTYIWDPTAIIHLDVQQVGRVLNFNSGINTVAADTIIYVRILFDRAGE